jgi:hypothetical protein
MFNRKRNHGKAHFQCGRKQQKRNKIDINNIAKFKLQDFIEYSRDRFTLQIDTLILKPFNEADQNFNIKIIKNKHNDLNSFQFLNLQEKCSVSEKNFIYMIKELNLPTKFCRIKKTKEQYKEIYKINENNYGFFFDPKEKILLVLSKIQIENKIEEGETFLIRLAGDTTNVTKPSFKLFNFTFTVINDKMRMQSTKGNYVLGKFLSKKIK